MKSLRRSLTALAVVALSAAGPGAGSFALAQENPGVVRITDQRTPSRATVRAQSPAGPYGVVRTSHAMSPEMVDGASGVPVESGSVGYGGEYGGPYEGQIIGGEYGGAYGGEWVGGEYSSCPTTCCDCDVRVTGNALLDAPVNLVGCCIVKPLFSKLFSHCGGGGWGGDGGGHLQGRNCRIYPVDPNHFDQRDGQVYSAEGYGIPMAVPLAPTVHHTYNYGWGVPSSRITPISRPVGQ